MGADGSRTPFLVIASHSGFVVPEQLRCGVVRSSIPALSALPLLPLSLIANLLRLDQSLLLGRTYGLEQAFPPWLTSQPVHTLLSSRHFTPFILALVLFSLPAMHNHCWFSLILFYYSFLLLRVAGSSPVLSSSLLPLGIRAQEVLQEQSLSLRHLSSPPDGT